MFCFSPAHGDIKNPDEQCLRYDFGQTVAKMTNNSKHSTSVMIGVEEDMILQESISTYETWFHGQGFWDASVLSLNLSRLSIRGWAQFLVNVAIAIADSGQHTAEQVVSVWMDVEAVYNHSDLILFLRSGGAMKMLASDFTKRPMGKPLPDIAKICLCLVSPTQAHLKFWQVKHNAQQALRARDVVLTVSCSFCCRVWRLPTSELAGSVKHRDGRYARVLAYSVEKGWL
ncbi:hypothetical protein RhiLY_03605 [Ceratobasidium sp. AG-Ba]|nr:hypothetical protein RhiLY_03605 [Ceratobasidium sp. AG-Ba]